MKESLFTISQMDCPSEENLIRIKLGDLPGILNLDFDIPNRKLKVFHNSDVSPIVEKIESLNLGGKLLNSKEVQDVVFKEETNQRKLLWTVLLINFAFFIIEMTTGLISRSLGLIADSLDMLADSFVYGISLLAVGATAIRKKSIAKLAGYFQLALALLGFIEVLRRFVYGIALPDFSTMIGVSILALAANGVCLYLLQQSKSKEEAHMKASTIFTSNDVIINLGVITAGVLVHWLNSNKPDLIIGIIVFVLVVQGAFRILKLSK